jgi:hypothetical protein
MIETWDKAISELGQDFRKVNETKRVVSTRCRHISDVDRLRSGMHPSDGSVWHVPNLRSDRLVLVSV